MRLASIVRLAVAAIAALPLASCRLIEGEDCIQLVAPAVVVAAVDAQSGDPVSTATLTVREGAFQETIAGTSSPATAPGILTAMAQGPGTYDLTVTAAGYQPWTQPGVTVTRGGSCNQVRTVSLLARLLRS